jgi:hypothetical protein
VEDFNKKWDAQFEETQKNDQAMIDKFKAAQENEVRGLVQRLQAYPPCLKRHSGEFHRLRRVQHLMSQQKMYEEAWDAKL